MWANLCLLRIAVARSGTCVGVGEPMITASISPELITASGSFETFPPKAAATFSADSVNGSTI